MTETKKPLIYGKILAIMADIPVIGKKRKNVSQGYSFRGIDDVYNELHDIFVKHKVFTVPTVLDTHHEERQSRSGGTLIYRIYTIKYTFYAEDGSSIDAIVIGEGMDSGDKAGNKALSVAHKYALLQILLVPTDEPKDPEEESHQINGKTKKDVRAESPPNVNTKFRTIPITVEGKKIMHTKYEVLDRFKVAKEKLGDEAYYKVLGSNGYEKANEIPEADIQKLYDAMLLAFKEEKAAPKKAKKAKEKPEAKDEAKDQSLGFTAEEVEKEQREDEEGPEFPPITKPAKEAKPEMPLQKEIMSLTGLEADLVDKHGFTPDQIIGRLKEMFGQTEGVKLTRKQTLEGIEYFKGVIDELNKGKE